MTDTWETEGGFVPQDGAKMQRPEDPADALHSAALREEMGKLTENHEDGDVEAIPDEVETIEVPLHLVVEANFQALKVVIAGALAQILGSDVITAKRVFEGLANEVDEHRARFVEMYLNAHQAMENAGADIDILRGSEETGDGPEVERSEEQA